jgi:dynein-related subfamily AAA family protein
MAIQSPPQATAPEFFPVAPGRTEDCGLPVARLADLLLKHIYFKSPLSAKDWAGALCLPYQTITPAIQSLVEQGWAQTIGRMAGPSLSQDFGESLGYLITDPGRVRARDVLARDHYVGPAPVPFLHYEESVRAQVSQADVTAAWLTRALQHLTLSNDLLVQLGPPVNARAPLFLYGAPGNGKTTIAEACAELLGDPVFIPYAIDIEGQIMRLYDPLHHQRVNRQMPLNFDNRWLLVKRPFVKAGGELTTAQLSPSFDPLMRYYEAPIHLKANGGIFLLDDFGRQDSSPRALLNRLIVALERRIDYLTLAGAGMAVGAPFEAMVVFSTNLEPASLVDEAFLRRVRYKIHVPDPTPSEFRQIFERACKEFEIVFNEAGYNYVLDRYYKPFKRPFRGCQPRDILNQLDEVAYFLGRPPRLEPDLIDLACRSYFVQA